MLRLQGARQGESQWPMAAQSCGSYRCQKASRFAAERLLGDWALTLMLACLALLDRFGTARTHERTHTQARPHWPSHTHDTGKLLHARFLLHSLSFTVRDACPECFPLQALSAWRPAPPSSLSAARKA